MAEKYSLLRKQRGSSNINWIMNLPGDQGTKRRTIYCNNVLHFSGVCTPTAGQHGDFKLKSIVFKIV